MEDDKMHRIKTEGIQILRTPVELTIPQGMTVEDALNSLVKDESVNANLISDGYHTFGELYQIIEKLSPGLIMFGQDETTNL